MNILHSLRTKLFALVIASIALTAIPIIAFTYIDIRSFNIDLQHLTFSNIITLIDDNVDSSYLDLLNAEIEKVLQRKKELHGLSQILNKIINTHTTNTSNKTLLKEIADTLRAEHVYIDIYNQNIQPLLKTPELRYFLNKMDSVDFKGRSVSELFALDKQNSVGEFAVLTSRFASQESENMPILAYFFPLADHNTLVVSVFLSDIFKETMLSRNRILAEIQDKIDSISIYPHSFISLFDSEGHLVAYRGDGFGNKVEDLPAGILQETKQKGKIQYIIPEENDKNEEHLLRAVHCPAFDWYIMLSAPLEEIEAPAEALVRHLTDIAIGAVLLGVLGTILITSRLVNPLRVLTKKVTDLPSVDLSSPEACLQLTTSLNFSQKDEVGQLANAFDLMGVKLNQNIRQLVETTASEERMLGELNTAKDIQQGLLPTTMITGETYSVAAILRPAKEVGGDLYDFFQLPDGRQVVVIGDVSGKGVPAALIMFICVVYIRDLIRKGIPVAQVAEQLNLMLSENNPTCLFVTLFMGIFDPRTGIFEYANGGHCPPLIVEQHTGKLRIVPETGNLVVGVMPGVHYTSQRVTLAPYESCLLYTDGITEAVNPGGDFFGEQRLNEFLQAHRADSPQRMVDSLLEAVVAFRQESMQSDDITMLCFSYTAATETQEQS